MDFDAMENYVRFEMRRQTSEDTIDVSVSVKAHDLLYLIDKAREGRRLSLLVNDFMNKADA